MQTMQERGVRSARVADIWDETWQDSYDTLLLLMNGTGLAGRYQCCPKRFIGTMNMRLLSTITPSSFF